MILSRWRRPVILVISTRTNPRNSSRCLQPNRFDPCDTWAALTSVLVSATLQSYSTTPLPRQTQFTTPCRTSSRVSSRGRCHSTARSATAFEDSGNGSHLVLSSQAPRRHNDKSNIGPTNATKHLNRKLKHSNTQAGTDGARKSSSPRTAPFSKSWKAAAPAKVKQENQYKLQKGWQWSKLRHMFPKDVLKGARKSFQQWSDDYVRCAIHGRKLAGDRATCAQWLYSLDTIKDMRVAWESLDAGERREQWPSIMLSTMNSRPEKTRKVLTATVDLDSPTYAIQDTLFFIASRLDLNSIKSRSFRSIRANRIVDLLADLLHRFPKDRLLFHDYVCAAFVRKLPPAQAKDLYDLMIQTKRGLRTDTALQFISKLAKAPDYKMKAFETFKETLTAQSQDDSKQIDLNDAKFASVITTLLMRYDGQDVSSEGNGNAFSSTEILQFFMERGFTPNIITLTALLTDLGRKGEFDEATRLAALFIEAGVVLDENVVKLMIRNAKSSLSADNVVKALRVTRVTGMSKTDACNNALHSVFYWASVECSENRLQKSPITPLFPLLLKLYAKRFDLEGLQQWVPETLALLMDSQSPWSSDLQGEHQESWEFEQSIVPGIDSFFSQWEGPLLPPDATTLTIMLRAYLKSIENPQDLLAFYTFFKSKCRDHGRSHPLVRQMLDDHNTALLDTLILTMTEREGMVRFALQVFGDMLSAHTRTASDAFIITGSPSSMTPAGQRFFPPPSIFTYTITLRGLFDKGEVPLAEEVIHCMRENGVDLTLPTYNTVIKGHATRQDVEKTVRAMQELEMAGYAPNEKTLAAFEKLKDQESALKMMEDIIQRNRDELEKGDWGLYL